MTLSDNCQIDKTCGKIIALKTIHSFTFPSRVDIVGVTRRKCNSFASRRYHCSQEI